MKYTILLALFALAGCSDKDGGLAVDPRISDATRPLVFLANPTEPPCTYRNEAGEIVGSDIDLARQIAAKMGREIVLEEVEFIDIHGEHFSLVMVIDELVV